MKHVLLYSKKIGRYVHYSASDEDETNILDMMAPVLSMPTEARRVWMKACWPAANDSQNVLTHGCLFGEQTKDTIVLCFHEGELTANDADSITAHILAKHDQ